MTNQEKQFEALARAKCTGGINIPMTNYPTIINGFLAKGIPLHDIKPRENVFTYQAWKALGRFVRKGEHGIKVITFVPMEFKDKQDPDKKRTKSRPWSTTVFHISQTEPIENDNQPGLL